MRDNTEPVKQKINHWLDSIENKPERYISPLGKMFMQINDMKSNNDDKKKRKTQIFATRFVALINFFRQIQFKTRLP